jgi:hypothetical protein
MSWAKLAAEEIVPSEDDQDAKDRRKRLIWTLVGLAGAGGLGYLGYKNWDTIRGALGGKSTAERIGGGALNLATNPLWVGAAGASMPVASVAAKRMWDQRQKDPVKALNTDTAGKTRSFAKLVDAVSAPDEKPGFWSRRFQGDPDPRYTALAKALREDEVFKSMAAGQKGVAAPAVPGAATPPATNTLTPYLRRGGETQAEFVLAKLRRDHELATKPVTSGMKPAEVAAIDAAKARLGSAFPKASPLDIGATLQRMQQLNQMPRRVFTGKNALISGLTAAAMPLAAVAGQSAYETLTNK